jgi:protease PrsW
MVPFVLSLAPVIVIAIYIYIRDKYEREPVTMLLKGLFLGALATFMVIGVGAILHLLVPQDSSLVSLLYQSFIVAGLNEEFFKFLPFMLFIWKDRNFNENFDGIVYAVFISLGFAGVENIFYVIEGGIGTGIVRAFTAVPAHALFGVVMGYFISKAKFSVPKKRLYLFYALLFAVLLHGTYDAILFMILQPGMGMAVLLLVLLFILFLLFLYILGFRKINESVESSQFRDKPPNQ